MKKYLLLALLALQPLTVATSSCAPSETPLSPAPLTEPTAAATEALQRVYQINRTLARLFGAMYPDVADYFDTRAEVIAEVYYLLFGVLIPEIQPGVQKP